MRKGKGLGVLGQYLLPSGRPDNEEDLRKGAEPEGSLWTKFGINRTNYGLTIFDLWCTLMGFLGGSVVKNSPATAGYRGDTGLIPGLRRSLGGGNGNPLQYSCLESSMDRGAWRAIVHRVAKSRTHLSDGAHMHAP